MCNIHLYQIAYSQETLKQIEPEYKVLDNLDNPRPDWYEYWPIRKFLLATELNENDFYGFFSPKFKNKTNLPYSAVYDFIKADQKNFDIFLFSPQYDMGAFFINVFEQAEFFDPGFTKSFENFLDLIGFKENFQTAIMDSNQIVFSNYFVAKASFWKEWFSVTERLFYFCENQNENSTHDFCIETSYPGKAQRKIFMIERIASYLLSNRNKWKSKSANSIKMGWSSLPTNKFVSEAIISDALKISYNKTLMSEYLAIYSEMRNKVFNNNLKSGGAK